jgi:hypothetical protein
LIALLHLVKYCVGVDEERRSCIEQQQQPLHHCIGSIYIKVNVQKRHQTKESRTYRLALYVTRLYIVGATLFINIKNISNRLEEVSILANNCLYYVIHEIN